MTTEAAMTSEEMTSAEIIVSSSAETMAPLDATTERSGYMTSEEVTEDDLDLVTMDEVTVEMTDSSVTTAPNIVRSEVTTASVMIVTEKKEEVQVARGLFSFWWQLDHHRLVIFIFESHHIFKTEVYNHSIIKKQEK